MNKKLVTKKLVTGIDLIIKDLATTKLSFVRSQLHVHDDDNNKCYYCAEGVLLKKAGVDKEEFTGAAYIRVLENDEEAEEKLKTRYNLDFTENYHNDVLCKICSFPMSNLEEVIIHLNDEHSNNHVDISQHIKSLSEVYNLVDGHKLAGGKTE
jgi:hypothetical protein